MATVSTNIAREYSDLDLNFTIHPVKKDINRNVGDMAVINSIKNLVLTNHYERPFQPDVGSNVRRLLFENMDNITASAIEREITQVIQNFEPRVIVQGIEITDDVDNNAYEVSITFQIIATEQVGTATIILERLR